MNMGKVKNVKYAPFVFTEQGIYMLATVLKSDIAIQQSEFKKFRKEANEKFKQIFDYISEHEESNQKIFYDGQIYDAFSILVKLVQEAKQKIILIDNYVDVTTLNILSKKNDGVNVTLYTYPRTSLTNTDISKFNAQYPHLEVKYTKDFHDRFLVIDDNKVVHIGASLKDAGKKCFGISRIENVEIATEFINKIV